MESRQWFSDRHAAENVLRVLAVVNPAALKTLQDAELTRLIQVLAQVMVDCGHERRQRRTPNGPHMGKQHRGASRRC